MRKSTFTNFRPGFQCKNQPLLHRIGTVNEQTSKTKMNETIIYCDSFENHQVPRMTMSWDRECAVYLNFFCSSWWWRWVHDYEFWMRFCMQWNGNLFCMHTIPTKNWINQWNKNLPRNTPNGTRHIRSCRKSTENYETMVFKFKNNCKNSSSFFSALRSFTHSGEKFMNDIKKKRDRRTLNENEKNT